MVDTPGSSSSQAHATKDRTCKWCSQTFTSSSLGRHLDLYIREKNPKSADGIHDVEEIRAQRASITRRQVRNLGRNDRDAPSSGTATPLAREQDSPPLPAYPSERPFEDDSRLLKTYINRANWQATGVINDLPETLQPRVPGRENGSRKNGLQRLRTNQGQDPDPTDLLDRARATEYALSEVLENLKTTNQRVNPSTPVDFNFFSQSFPQIYLRCLSSPLSLRTEPVTCPQGLSWSISRPDREQCRNTQTWLEDRLTEWRKGREDAISSSPQHGQPKDGMRGGQPEKDSLRKEEQTYHEHLEREQRRWLAMTERQQHEEWTQELARAFTHEKEAHESTKQKLAIVSQQLTRLRAQNEQNGLTDRQHPSIVSLLSHDALSHLPPDTAWDFNTLVHKWRKVLQSARSSEGDGQDRIGTLADIACAAVPAQGSRPSSLAHRGDSWPSRGSEPRTYRDEEEEDNSPTTQPGGRNGFIDPVDRLHRPMTSSRSGSDISANSRKRLRSPTDMNSVLPPIRSEPRGRKELHAD